MEIKAAVCRATHVPVGIESIDIDRPLGREVLVRTVATGVCHSDLHVVDGDGRFALDRGIVLGHEGAGIVEAVGDRVTALRPGDHVVACLSGFCGSCAQCLSGHPNVCVGGAVARSESAPPRLSKKGQGIPSFAGIGSYAERMLLHENSVVKIDDDLPLDRAALVGCGVLTGVGAALRSAGLEAGQTVAVFGCGGVGLSIVQGARIGGARQIIALDRFDSKLEMARRVGATHVVNTSSDDPVEAVRALSGRQHDPRASGHREPGHPRHRHHRRRPAARREDRVPLDGHPPRVSRADLPHGRQPLPHRHSAVPRLLSPGPPSAR
jgi:S-(hydroxymethyl)glutathione dehydrogenase/alcohol dehydrogenase